MRGRWLSGLVVALVLVLGVWAWPPGAPGATTQAAMSPPPGLAIFQVPASNGFELLVTTGTRRGGGAEITLQARSPGASVSYRAAATVSHDRVEADLGPIGRVRLVPTGKKRTVRRPCGERERIRVGVPRYEGTIEFRGEEGFSEARAAGAPFDWATYLAFSCLETDGRPLDKGLSGPRLIARRPLEGNRLILLAARDRAGSRTEALVQVEELRDGLGITRQVTTRAGAEALAFSPGLSAATLAPPAPFHGQATFRANAAGANRWTGDLSVDLPGYSRYPLVGPGVKAELGRPRA